MAWRPTCLSVAASFGLGALSAAGQSAAPAPAAPLPPVFAPAAPAFPAPPPAARPMSPEMAAALAAALPKYDPPAAQPAGSAPSATAAPAAAPPKNGIVRLPDYIVRDAKIREFSERELYTPKGLQDLAVKRYISEFDLALNHFRIPLFSGYSTAPDLGSTPEKRAMAQYEADETRERLQEIGELWSLENIQSGPIDSSAKK